MEPIKSCLLGLGVPTKTEEKIKPIKLEELREHLKHIACLCWGLSIDIESSRKELQKVDGLNAENKRLKGIIENLNVQFKQLKTEYEKERKAIYNRQYGREYRRKQKDGKK